MDPKLPRPPYDPEVEAVLPLLPIPHLITREMIVPMREGSRAMENPETALAGKLVSHEERSIPGPGGDITLSIVRSTATAPSVKPEGRPAIYMIHGGGMVMGSRFLFMNFLADWVIENDAIGFSVEYRLAPEHPDPAPVEDCYAGLKWVAENASELGINHKKLLVAGQSGGGGLAAGVALLARDRGAPALCGQLLVYPMLDDRNKSVSSLQYRGAEIWNQETNIMAWDCVLGDKRGSEDVSIYAAPARAKDLSGLPPTFIDVASAETFRDEDVAYASLLWESGVQAELHVWPGGFHGSDAFVPHAAISQAAIRARAEWIRRILSPGEKL